MRIAKLIFFAVATALFAQPASATVSLSAVYLSGSTWQLAFRVTNASATKSIRNLSVYVSSSFSSIALGPSQPVGWTAQSDGALLPGFTGFSFETVSSNPGIVPGGELGGFSVRVDSPYIGASQFSSGVFAKLDQELLSPLSIPEAGSLLFICAGLALLALWSAVARRAGTHASCPVIDRRAARRPYPY